MKKIIKAGLVITLALVMLIVSAGTVLADSNPSEIEVEGTITAINVSPAPTTITVTPESGGPVVLKVDATTMITKKGLVTITINDRVNATYNKDTNVARRIAVDQQMGEHHSFAGTIKTITGTTLVVTTKKADETISVNAETQYKVPGVKDATLANFKVGDKVSVSTIKVTTGGTTVQMAQRVTYIPGKPVELHRHGIVTAYTANTSITIQDKKGNSSTFFIINGDTKIVLRKGVTVVAIGDQVTITAQRTPSESQFTAKSIRDAGVPKTRGHQNSVQNTEHGNSQNEHRKNN